MYPIGYKNERSNPVHRWDLLSSREDVFIHFHGRSLMETLRQGIIRPACQARRVWHVVKRPPRLFPEEFSLSPFLPALPTLLASATVANPPEGGEGGGRCKNTCIPTKDNDYHGRMPRNTAQRNFYGTFRREIPQKVAALWNYIVTLSYARSFLSLFSSLSVDTRTIQRY